MNDPSHDFIDSSSYVYRQCRRRVDSTEAATRPVECASGASPVREPAPLRNAPLQAAMTLALVLECRRLIERLCAIGGRLHGDVAAGVVLAAVLVGVLVMMAGGRGGCRLREGSGGNEKGEAGDQDALHGVTR
ncbi:hypothetical protein [Paraburkholderia tropica]|uniref:hypothetical protein n=1 Tax=Paraburkholderia tropica TaxID=92647 RepID=UPI00115FF2DE|nr:hypothetical protein [Paraburkholderia tropica]